MFRNKNIIFFSFLAHETLRATVTLFFSNFFEWSFSDGKFIPSQLYLFIKGLIFVIVCRFFLISSWFKVKKIICYPFLLLKIYDFLSNHENLYMIHHNSDLFSDIYNTINEDNPRQTHYLLSILNYFDINF